MLDKRRVVESVNKYDDSFVNTLSEFRRLSENPSIDHKIKKEFMNAIGRDYLETHV